MNDKWKSLENGDKPEHGRPFETINGSFQTWYYFGDMAMKQLHKMGGRSGTTDTIYRYLDEETSDEKLKKELVKMFLENRGE